MLPMTRKAQRYTSKVTANIDEHPTPINASIGGLFLTPSVPNRNSERAASYKDKLAPNVEPSPKPTDIIGNTCSKLKPHGIPVSFMQAIIHPDISSPEESIEEPKPKVAIRAIKGSLMMVEPIDEPEPEVDTRPKVKVQTPEDITAMIEETM